MIVMLGVVLLPTSFFAASKKDIIFPFVLDRFEDGDIRYNPEWFTFGNLAVNVVPAVSETPPTMAKKQESWKKRLSTWWLDKGKINTEPPAVLTVDPVNGRYVLDMEGLGRDWFVGGVGTYLGIKADQYSYFYIRIKGIGKNSGRLQVELYDDDNGNFKLEQNPKEHYEPTFDDKFTYVIPVTWSGWRDIQVPLADFKDDNARVGDNILNLNQTGKSGGLLQVQLVGLTPEGVQVGRFSIQVDSIEFR